MLSKSRDADLDSDLIDFAATHRPDATGLGEERGEIGTGRIRSEQAPGERREPEEGAVRLEKTFAPREAARAPSRRKWTRPLLFALLPLALAGGAYMYVTGGRFVSTDDAYVNARQVGISTDVAGIVSEVDVRNNQYVSAGQVLYRLDPRQLQIALDNAQSNLAQIALSVASMKKDYAQMLSDVAAQQAQVQLDQANYERYAALLQADAIAKATYDQSRFSLQTDNGRLSASREQALSELAKLNGDANIAVQQLPQYQQALAQVREAQRELDHTTIRAPFSGTVTDVPSIAPGKYLAASTTAFYLVDTDHVWIDATPKETELTNVWPGQPATVTIDAYPNVKWQGAVESISPAAAQQFSLLPAQNTSGNWVKVVQRVPMRIGVDTTDKAMPPLRAGMSVVVSVDTGRARGLPHFLTRLF
jgi:membrane fusion protein (multidrug efflux system)